MHWTEFEDKLDAIMEGKAPLPNYKRMPFPEGVAQLCLAGWATPVMGTGLARSPYKPLDPYAGWARYFLCTMQGGALAGSGLVMLYRGETEAEIGSFAICKHKPVTGAGANPNYGWHPARCSVCNLDMSVDSSD